MTKVVPVIAIDGPGGSGKGTIGLLVAKELGYHFLDSGALYRLVALAAKHHAMDLSNESALAVLAGHMDVAFGAGSHGEPRVFLEGEDVTEEVRSDEAGRLASSVAVFPAVREALLERQRAFRQAPGLVADGRDMGTVVFPDAPVKVFLTASASIRAERRHRQLKQMRGAEQLQVSDEQSTIAALLKSIEERDERDRNRSVAPLKPATDAVEIDATELSIEATKQRVLDIVKARLVQ